MANGDDSSSSGGFSPAPGASAPVSSPAGEGTLPAEEQPTGTGEDGDAADDDVTSVAEQQDDGEAETTGGVSTPEGPRQVTPGGEEVATADPEPEPQPDAAGVSTPTGPQLVTPGGEEVGRDASVEDVREFGAALDREPETVRQRQILRQQSRINELREDGFTRREREAAQAGMAAVESAEQLTESRQAEERLRQQRSRLQQRQEQLQDVEGDATILAAAADDETRPTLTREEALERFPEGEAPEFVTGAPAGTEFVELSAGEVRGRLAERATELTGDISEQERFQATARENIATAESAEENILAGRSAGFVTEREQELAESREELQVGPGGGVEVDPDVVRRELGPVERAGAAAQVGFTSSLDVLAAGAVPGGDTAGDVTEERFAEIVRGDVSPAGQAAASLTQNPLAITGTGLGLGAAAGGATRVAAGVGPRAELAARGAIGVGGIGITAIEAQRVREQIESGEFEEAAETAARFGLGTAGFVGGFGRAAPAAAESSLVTSETTGTVGRIQTQFRPGETAELTGGLRGRLLSQVETTRQTVPRVLADRVPGVDVGPRTSTRFIETRIQSDTLRAGGDEVVGRIGGERFDVPRVLDPQSGRVQPRPEFGESRGTGADVFEASTADADVAGVPRQGLRFTQDLPPELVGTATVGGARSVGVAQPQARVETPQGRAELQDVLGVTGEGTPFRVSARTEVFRTDEVASARDVSGDQRLDLEAADRDIVNVRDLVETAESIFGESTAAAGRAETVETTIGTATGTDTDVDAVAADTTTEIETDRPGVTIDEGGGLRIEDTGAQDFTALPRLGREETGRTDTGVDQFVGSGADTAADVDIDVETETQQGRVRQPDQAGRPVVGQSATRVPATGTRQRQGVGFDIALEQVAGQRSRLQQRTVQTPIQATGSAQVPRTAVLPGFALPPLGGGRDVGIDTGGRGGVTTGIGEANVPDILSASQVELGGREAVFPEDERDVDFGPLAALQPVEDADVEDETVAGVDVSEVEYL